MGCGQSTEDVGIDSKTGRRAVGANAMAISDADILAMSQDQGLK